MPDRKMGGLFMDANGDFYNEAAEAAYREMHGNQAHLDKLAETQDQSLCPFDGTSLTWMGDMWYCPTCQDEWHPDHLESRPS